MLWRRISEVLHYVWDPCQAAQVPQARDEYESYVPQVYAALAAGASAGALAKLLAEIERSPIGSGGSAESNQEVGDLLVEWREHLRGQHT
ncbi:hypothetical protein LA521A_33430 [Lysobacter auxotrophicus]|uniref:Uncharacterized protein n=1 Tax=Lysobacter auxotrophicus TaxID=2992573 RepID=A0ABM8DHM9_9GAMM|nr:hypothetical protein LA521A_33430 [Lysobacter auxotrophicus]